MKSSISKSSGTYPDTDFHWFLGFLSDSLPLGLEVELSLGIYHFFKKNRLFANDWGKVDLVNSLLTIVLNHIPNLFTQNKNIFSIIS